MGAVRRSRVGRRPTLCATSRPKPVDGLPCKRWAVSLWRAKGAGTLRSDRRETLGAPNVSHRETPGTTGKIVWYPMRHPKSCSILTLRHRSPLTNAMTRIVRMERFGRTRDYGVRTPFSLGTGPQVDSHYHLPPEKVRNVRSSSQRHNRTTFCDARNLQPAVRCF